MHIIHKYMYFSICDSLARVCKCRCIQGPHGANINTIIIYYHYHHHHYNTAELYQPLPDEWLLIGHLLWSHCRLGREHTQTSSLAISSGQADQPTHRTSPTHTPETRHKALHWSTQICPTAKQFLSRCKDAGFSSVYNYTLTGNQR